MKNKIVLPFSFTNSKRAEYFLNAVEVPLQEAPFDKSAWKLSDRIEGGCTFVAAPSENPLQITVWFCDSYSDANEIAKANQLPQQPQARWSLNGNLLYLVESEDADQVSEVLGIFAGEE